MSLHAIQVLLVDDDTALRDMLRAYLEAESFAVVEASNGPDGLAVAASAQPDIVILDVGLPGLDGFEVLRELRTRTDTPVIMLSARTEEVDRVVGLSVGADDYVVKPFSPRELVARIRAVLRRADRREPDAPEEVLRFGRLQIFPERREVHTDDRVVELTTLEFDLLLTLARSPRRVFTRDQLLELVWGYDFVGVDRVVDVHIASLRRALNDDAGDPEFIGTVRGVGYKFLRSAD